MHMCVGIVSIARPSFKGCTDACKSFYKYNNGTDPEHCMCVCVYYKRVCNGCVLYTVLC